MRVSTKNIIYLLAFLSVAVLIFIAACSSRNPTDLNSRNLTLSVSDAWARHSPAREGAMAAYLTIKNSSEEDELLSASTDIAEVVELHKTSMEDDVMKMEPVESIGIPANEEVELKPGGLHVMLKKIKEEIKEGDTFGLSLEFENAGVIEIDVEVKSATSSDNNAGNDEANNEMGGH